MLDNVIPDRCQVLHQLCLSGLGIEVCHTCIEIIGTYGMSHGFILLAERYAILVVVFSVFYRIAYGNKPFGELQILWIASGTIHFCGTHIV